MNVPSESPRLQSPTTPPPGMINLSCIDYLEQFLAVFDSAIFDDDDGNFISISFTAIRPYDGGPVQLIIQHFTDFREKPLRILTDYTKEEVVKD